MEYKINTKENNSKYGFAKNLIAFLYKIGQIKKMPTEEEMREYWIKSKSSK